MIRKFSKNQTGRDFFVGDLHGMYDLFMHKLTVVDFDFENDRVFSVGDLVDRGPKSFECLQLIEKPWFHCVIGNHEELMMGSHGRGVWLYNGGDWSLRFNREELDPLRDLVNEKVHSAMQVETFLGTVGVVHAESYNQWELNEIYAQDKHTWAREKIQRNDTTQVRGVDRVVVGHTVVDVPRRLGNTVYIDTGAVFTNNLTLISVQELFDIPEYIGAAKNVPTKLIELANKQ